MSDLLSELEHCHFRRCHICGMMNERNSQLVDKCSACNKSLAPFVFFDEKKALGLSADESPEDRAKKTCTIKITRLATQTIYPPIWGITVYW